MENKSNLSKYNSFTRVWDYGFAPQKTTQIIIQIVYFYLRLSSLSLSLCLCFCVCIICVGVCLCIRVRTLTKPQCTCLFYSSITHSIQENATDVKTNEMKMQRYSYKTYFLVMNLKRFCWILFSHYRAMHSNRQGSYSRKKISVVWMMFIINSI